MGLKTSEILLIVVVLLVLFGAARLPELGRSLGAGLRSLKQGLGSGDDDRDPHT